MTVPFQNFWKSSVRSLIKSKINTLISLTGLAIGFLASIIIVQYNFYEKSYDDFHRNNKNIYRIIDHYQNATTSNVRASVFYPVATALQHDLPEIENATHFAITSGVLKKEENIFTEDQLVLTEPSFFEIFSVPVTQGNYRDLKETNSIMLSETLVVKYFGANNPMGQLLDVKGVLGLDFTARVVGVFKDLPPNTHLRGDAFLSIKKAEEVVANGTAFGPGATMESVGWRWAGFYTYIKVHERVDIDALNTKITEVGNRYRKDLNKQLNQRHDLNAQPLLTIHTTPGYLFEITPAVNAKMLNVFYLIAALILLMAWINYINLSTARSINRAKEVGMRKVLGAGKNQLIIQFLFESFIMSLLALIIALSLLMTLHPAIENILNKSIFFNMSQNVSIVLLATGVIILGSVLAGVYPAFVLTAYNPLIVLKGKIKYSGAGIILRKSLVFFQFLVAIGLLTSLFVIKGQLNFLMSADIGANIDHTMTIQMPNNGSPSDDYTSRVEVLKRELMTRDDIQYTSVASIVPGIPNLSKGTVQLANNNETGSIYANVGFIDQGYVDLFGLKIVAGRKFSEAFTGDQKALIINRKAADEFGFKTPEEALNQYLQVSNNRSKIVGVIENFNLLGLQVAVEPIVFGLDTALVGNYLNVKIKTDNLAPTLDFIQSKFKNVFPEHPYKFSFLDEAFMNQYNEEKKFGQIFTFFSIVAISIACLGLFGLSSYLAAQKRKEVSIRKVLGSDMLKIFVLLNKEYIILSSASFAFTVPLVFYFMQDWLSTYHTRISIDLWMLVVPYLVIQIIVLVVTVSQTYETAVTNPAKTLREQ